MSLTILSLLIFILFKWMIYYIVFDYTCLVQVNGFTCNVFICICLVHINNVLYCLYLYTPCSDKWLIRVSLLCFVQVNSLLHSGEWLTALSLRVLVNDLCVVFNLSCPSEWLIICFISSCPCDWLTMCLYFVIFRQMTYLLSLMCPIRVNDLLFIFTLSCSGGWHCLVVMYFLYPVKANGLVWCSYFCPVQVNVLLHCLYFWLTFMCYFFVLFRWMTFCYFITLSSPHYTPYLLYFVVCYVNMLVIMNGYFLGYPFAHWNCFLTSITFWEIKGFAVWFWCSPTVQLIFLY